MTSYTELYLHSHWSLLKGASSPLELRAREPEYEALATTDHDGLYKPGAECEDIDV